MRRASQINTRVNPISPQTNTLFFSAALLVYAWCILIACSRACASTPCQLGTLSLSVPVFLHFQSQCTTHTHLLPRRQWHSLGSLRPGITNLPLFPPIVTSLTIKPPSPMLQQNPPHRQLRWVNYTHNPLRRKTLNATSQSQEFVGVCNSLDRPTANTDFLLLNLAYARATAKSMTASRVLSVINPFIAPVCGPSSTTLPQLTSLLKFPEPVLS